MFGEGAGRGGGGRETATGGQGERLDPACNGRRRRRNGGSVCCRVFGAVFGGCRHRRQELSCGGGGARLSME